MTDPSLDPDTPPPRKPWTTTERLLLGSIVLMTSVILVGLVAVAVRMITGGGPREAYEARITLDGPVESMALDGDRIAIRTTGAEGRSIRIYDLRTGIEEGRIAIEAPE